MVSYYTHTITVREIIDAVPDTILVIIPDEWFAHIPKNKGVYDSFYEYIAEKYGMDKNWAPLHQVYVGDIIDEKLEGMVRDKIKREHRLKGSKLEESVGWADFSSGPQRLIHTWMKVVGPDALILLDTELDSPQHKAISSLWWQRLQDRNAKIAREAKGNSFYSWLIKNVDREDRIGDIAGDIKLDVGFPSNVVSYHEAKSYLEAASACDGAMGSMRMAWVEYTQKYPERQKPVVVCSYCGDQIDSLASAIIALRGWFDPWEFYHPASCFADKIDEEWDGEDIDECEYDGVYTSIEDKTIQEIISFMKDGFSSRWGKCIEECSMEEHYGRDIKEKEDELLLAGILQSRGVRKTSRGNGIPMVYFIQAEGYNLVKIGFSTSVATRFSTLATASPMRLILILTVQGDRGLEKSLHARFAHLRENNEWFRLEDELLNYIDSIKEGT